MTTNFIFENEARVRQLSAQYFVEGKIERINSLNELMVYKYILSYRILTSGKFDLRALALFKEEARRLDVSLENNIFLEKVERCAKDFIYFKNYMDKVEKLPSFLSTWHTWFEKVA